MIRVSFSCFGRPLVDEERTRPGHWLHQCFDFPLMLWWQKWHPTYKNLWHIPKGSFQQQMEEETKGEPVNPGSPWKQLEWYILWPCVHLSGHKTLPGTVLEWLNCLSSCLEQRLPSAYPILYCCRYRLHNVVCSLCEIFCDVQRLRSTMTGVAVSQLVFLLHSQIRAVNGWLSLLMT